VVQHKGGRREAENRVHLSETGVGENQEGTVIPRGYFATGNIIVSHVLWP